METGNVLGVLGILATVVFGIWGVVLVIRHRYPGRITLVKESCIGLFDAIVKNLPELRVLYNDAPVGKGLVLLKGAFVNTGSKDITAEMTEQRLALNLPADYKWLTARIVGNSPELQAKLKVQKNGMEVETGLFRKGESILFEAVAEVSAGPEERTHQGRDMAEELWRSLAATHRIADTQPVEKVDLSGESTSLLSRIDMAIFFAAILSIVLAGAVDVMLRAHKITEQIGTYRHSALQSTNGQTVFVMASTNSEFDEVEIKQLTNGLVQVKNLKSNLERTLSVTNIYELHRGTGVHEPQKYAFPLSVLVALCLSLCILVIIRATQQWRDERRLRKLLRGEKLSSRNA